VVESQIATVKAIGMIQRSMRYTY